jgi:Reverse transcriptase (RNA-dependent DNA polymerase)
LELLGNPPEIQGPRPRRLPARYKQDNQTAESPDDEESSALAEIAYMVVAAMSTSGAQSDPRTYDEAMSRDDAHLWIEAIRRELNTLERTGMYETLESLPLGRKAIDAKLVFKAKHLPDGAIERYKVRLVAKGYYQIPGVDFKETFAPVVKLTSIRILCALAVRLGLHFHHLDVQTVNIERV